MTIGLALVLGVLAAEPGGCFPAEAGVDAFRTEWYCKHLTAAGLGQLATDPGIRFTYLPTFQAPRVVTVEMTSEGAVATGIVLSGRGGYAPGSVAKRTRTLLKPDEWKLLQQRLEDAGMWEAAVKQSSIGLDGSQWILEGRRSGTYRLHDLWSPDRKDYPQYVNACVYLLELAGITSQADEIY